VGSSSPGGSIALAVGPHNASVHGGLGVQGSTRPPPTPGPWRSVGGGQCSGREGPTGEKGGEISCSYPLPSPTPRLTSTQIGGGSLEPRLSDAESPSCSPGASCPRSMNPMCSNSRREDPILV